MTTRSCDLEFSSEPGAAYSSVHVLLLQWEDDDLNVRPERERLQTVFMSYGFKTESWLIPSENPYFKLTRKAVEFIQAHRDEHGLMIVYYGGHGKINRYRQATWVCNRTPESPTIDWTAIQNLFEAATSRVLVILDSCAAGSAALEGGCATMEILTACGWECIAPRPGEYSFTNALIRVLEANRLHTFSIGYLYREIHYLLKREYPVSFGGGALQERTRTPVYMPPLKPGIPSMVLCRQPPSVIPIPFDPAASDLITSRPLDNPLNTCAINEVDITEPEDVKETIEAKDDMSQKPLASKEDQPRDRETWTCQIAMAPLTVEEPTAVFHEEEKRNTDDERNTAEIIQQLDAFYELSAAGKIIPPDELLEFGARLKLQAEKESTRNSLPKTLTEDQQLHIENRVAEIAEFNVMKKSLMRDLQGRCERVVELEILLDETREQLNNTLRSSNNRVQQKKMAFLERSVEQLIYVHKQMVEQNGNLKEVAIQPISPKPNIKK